MAATDHRVQVMIPAPSLPPPGSPSLDDAASTTPASTSTKVDRSTDDADDVHEADANIHPSERLLRQATRIHRSYLTTAGDAQRRFLQAWPGVAAAQTPHAGIVERSVVSLSLGEAPWLSDHRPFYTTAVVPLACLADMFAACALRRAPNARLTGLRDLHVSRWVVVGHEPTSFTLETEPHTTSIINVRLLSWRDASDARLSRFEAVASARVDLADVYRPLPSPPSLLPALVGGVRATDPYADALLFHGPAFQLLREMTVGENGANAVIDAGRGSVPNGVLHPALLDALVQSSVHVVHRRHPRHACIPIEIPWLHLHGPVPTGGDVRCEVRPIEQAASERLLTFELQGSNDAGVWASLRVVMALLPLGRFGALDPLCMRAYLRDREFVPDALLSYDEQGRTVLRRREVAGVGRPPGALEDLYGIQSPSGDLHTLIAIKEHAARRARVHPCGVLVDADLRTYALPDGTRVAVDVDAAPDVISVTTGGERP